MKKWKHKARVEKMSEAYHALEQEAASRIADLTHQRDSLATSCKELNRLCEEAKKIMDDQQKENERLAGEIRIGNTYISRLREQDSRKAAKIEELMGQLDVAKGTDGGFRRAMERLSRENNKLKEDLEKAQKDTAGTVNLPDLRGAGPVVMIKAQDFRTLKRIEDWALRQPDFHLSQTVQPRVNMIKETRPHCSRMSKN